ncbi:MAG: hypothetical protein AB7K37_14705 [Cyclobacteriaceae bacterium]
MSNVKNVVAFEQLLGYCTGFGGSYNPGHSHLQVKAMQTLLKKAKDAMQQVKVTRTEFNDLTNEREIAFKQMKVLASKVVFNLAAAKVTDQKLADARQYFRLITGRIATQRPPVPGEVAAQPTVAGWSGRQLNYASLADNFQKLVQTVSTEPLYQANEPELTIDGLKAKANYYQSLNTRIAQASAAGSNARIQRDQLLYNGDEALVTTASSAKKYVRVAYGFGSDQHRQLIRLRFTKPNKR